METYASPVIGKLQVNAITTDHVMKVLEPHWHEKTDTAKRVRGRIETVLNYATVRKFRHGDNPARWTGYLSELLARPSRVAPVQHHAALSYREIGNFMQALRSREGIGALAMEFTILTCARTSEVLGACNFLTQIRQSNMAHCYVAQSYPCFAWREVSCVPRE